MGKISKATKKFQTKKLDGVLKQRKEHKKVAQKFKSRKTKKPNGETAGSKDVKPKGARNEDLFDSMNVDEFMAGGFEAGAKKSNGKKVQAQAATEAEDSASEVSDASEDDSEDEVDATSHKDQLKDLSKTDPAFYKYLQENDEGLLNFDNAEEDDLVFSDDDEEVDGATSGRTGPEVLTLQTVEKWEEQLAEKSLRCVRKIVLAFRAAAHLNEETDKTYRYSIDDPQAFQRLTILAVVGLPKFLETYVPIKKNAAGKPKMPTDNKKFIKLIPVLKSHFATLLHFLQGLSDPDMQKRVLDSSIVLVGYMLTFRKFLKDYMKSVLEIWSTCTSDATRISAFLLIREFLVMGDAGLRESGLKLVYSSFIREARNINTHTLPLVNLMKNSASDLFGLDYGVSYQLIFGFLRQLAIVLRKSINEKTKDSYKTVYNWQFVNSLDFWSITLSHHAADPSSSLRPLIYPFVQVTLGAARLVPTSQFFPLRFHLIKSLNRLAGATNTYIPLAPLIFEVLETADMKRKPVPSTAKPMSFDTAIRAKEGIMRTKVYQDQVGEVAVDLLLDFYALHANSIAFPELSVPATVQIKRYIKKCKAPKLSRALAAVVERLNANAAFIEKKRDGVHFTPRDTSGMDKFSQDLAIEQTPLGGYVKVQRKMKDEAKALVAASEAREEQQRDKKRAKQDREMADLVSDASSDAEDEDEDMEEDE